MLDEIEFTVMGRYDFLVPRINCEFNYCPGGPWVVGKCDLDYLHTWRPKKDWLKTFVEETGSHDDQLIRFVLENAFHHGNNSQDYLPVSVKTFVGEKGIVVRVRDSGLGFDYQETVGRYRNGGQWYKNLGCGLKEYDRPRSEVAFEGDGNIVNFSIKW